MTQSLIPAQPVSVDGEVATLVTRGGSSDAQLMRVSVEIARQYPRDEAKIVQRLKLTLDTYPQFAEKALYSIPYQDRRSGRQVRVEGLSIRAAETLAAAWGNLRIGVRIVGEDEQGWDLEAVCFDMEKNLWELAPSRALKYEKTREGRLVLLDERRQLQARGAAVSKVKRNAVLSILPLHLKAFFEAEVRAKMAGGELNMPASQERVTRALARFEKDFKVSKETLEAHVGRPTTLWIGDDIADLQGLFNALEQGEVTVADAFEAAPAVVAAPTAPAVVEVRTANLRESPAPPPAVPEPIAPPPAPIAVEPPKAAKVKKATPYVVPPAQVEMPPAEPVQAAPGAVETVHRTLVETIAAATSADELDAILGHVYTDRQLAREVKRDMLARITARRDEITAASQ